MTEKKEKPEKRLLLVGYLLILAELIGIGVFFLWQGSTPGPSVRQ